ncbi:hypothetical protein JDV02_004534 [Purpureocillium takamizusanense]|uniref:Uncharacterized protein n=1 Tax=Purpureocillium takamizusanense TaxID=2060973 RepID=A0A9Q8QG65_9HYPO|nr:uncharacterized protein JDV02_004534 [Purpureocillium takamizusanense]UNI18256.1 hypothetical protein JDV02_004534 [Purpureocillium takamizusanense]
MDNPNPNAGAGGGGGSGSGSDPQQQQQQHAMSRAEYSRNVRAAIEEKRQQALHNRQRFEPIVHEQLQRLLRDYQPPLYARLRGFGREQTLALAESTVSSLAAANRRAFSDAETQALAEHFVDSIHTMLVWKWAMTGLAAYMTYRGRNTWRFPFLRPKMNGRLLPSPVTGGPLVKVMWHSARFVAYYGAIWVLGEPIFQGANFMRYRAAMEQDPRLAAMLRDGKARAQEVFDQVSHGQAGGGGVPSDRYGSSGDQYGGGGGDQYGNSGEQYGEQWNSESQPQRPTASIPARAQSAWTQYRSPETQSQQPQPSAPQQDSWDSFSDVDDASPVAPTAQGQQDASANYGGGSAWDRVRQQAQYQPKRGPQQQQQQQQQQPQQSWQAPQGTGGWASEDDASPQRGSRDSYSFSNADEERALAKSQAQREFDQLLERERRGTDQEQGSSSSWGRRR